LDGHCPASLTGVDAVALHEGHSQTTTPEAAIRLGAGLGGHCRR
jgi:hypothetical protein